jgi:porphobilinogen synthase
MVSETSLSVNNLIYPMFVVHGKGIKKEIKTLAGNYHFSIDLFIEEVKKVRDLGIPAIMVFGLPEDKDKLGSEAYSPNGIVQQAIIAVKKTVPDIIMITDVCLCEYTHHSHCGIIKNGELNNDETVDAITKIALSHAEVGADIVAPAGIIDGQVNSVRKLLDEKGHHNTIIMSYAVRYASKLYDPFFKSGTESTTTFGDKKSYQMDYANRDEAMREIAADIQEGADIIMIQPGIFYLDIVSRAKDKFRVPIAVYNVSGEYTMIKSAAQLGRINEKEIIMEVLTAFKRAGADLIMTYFARSIANDLKS